MVSNFEFLEKDFPVLSNFGEMAEKYCYSDSNSCLMKLRMIGETIVNLMFTYDRISFPQDNTAVARIDTLSREGLLTSDLVTILHGLRKVRNKAVHENYASVADDKTFLPMAHSLCEWFIDEEIPFDIPDRWTWCRLQSISSILTDGTHKTPEYSDSGYMFLSSKNVTSGKIDWENVMYIPEYLHEELYGRLAPAKDDILLAKNGTTGVAAIVDHEEVFDIYVSLALIRIINNMIFPEYILHTIGSSYIQNYFNSSLKGIGVPNLHLEHIRKTLIPIPTYTEQKLIAEKIKHILYKIHDISNALL